MFGLPKLLVLIAVIALVWYGFKLFGRLEQNRRSQVRRRGAGKSGTPPDAAHTMVRCPVCETYVAADGAGNCGRSDCPY